MKFTRELNAVIAIAGREVMNVVRQPQYLIFMFVFPLIFIGLLGGMLSQNLGQGLGFDLMRFIFIGMLVNNIYQTTMNGVTSLIEDRENGFTQEMFVAPVSRYSVILGKVLGSGIMSIVTLVSIFLVALVMGVSISLSDVGHILLIAPIIALSGAALGIFFIGFVRSPKMADIGSFLLIFPQLFLSGAMIPVHNSSGFLNWLVHAMPMTYLIDLAHHIFYAGNAALQTIVARPVWIDLLVTAGIFLAFIFVGTHMFTRAERNR